MSEAALKAEVVKVIKIYEEVIGHPATRTWPMIEKYGVIEALSRLMISPDLQTGFKALRDINQLDKTFETLVVRFKHLFKPNIVEAAQWRLDNPYELLDK